MKCEKCGEEFDEKRTNARYCSIKCQQKAFYGRRIKEGDVRFSMWYSNSIWSRLINIQKIKEHKNMNETIEYVIEKGIEVIING